MCDVMKPSINDLGSFFSKLFHPSDPVEIKKSELWSFIITAVILDGAVIAFIMAKSDAFKDFFDNMFRGMNAALVNQFAQPWFVLTVLGIITATAIVFMIAAVGRARKYKKENDELRENIPVAWTGRNSIEKEADALRKAWNNDDSLPFS